MWRGPLLTQGILKGLCRQPKSVTTICGTTIRFYDKNKNKLLASYCTKITSLNGDDKKNWTPISDEVRQLTLMERLVNNAPSGIQPYLKLMRMDKPTGTLLLLWPCFWGMTLSSAPNPSLLALFACGALLMRGAGCTVNDLWDKEVDAKVSRTKNRPLASGDISVLDAWMFLGGQLSLALLVLLQLNWYSVVLGASSLCLVVTYPLVKRVSHWPQLMLGFTFNWGALLGWSAVHGGCQWSTVLPLYAAGVSWTMVYDTIYAHQDKVDDVLIKIKSTAIKFGNKTKHWLYGFSASMVTFLLLSGYTAQQTWPFYTSVGLTGTLLLMQVSSLNINDPQNCWRTFKLNQRIGLIIFLGIVSGTFMKISNEEKIEKTNLLAKD